MKKITVALTALAAVGAVALAGCSSDSTSSAPTKPTETGSKTPGGDAAGFEDGATIGISLPQKTSQNWVEAEQLFNQGLKAAGYNPVVQFANNGAAEQQSQIEAMIQQGAKVIVIGAVDGSQLSTQVEAAREAGIKIVAYDRLIKETDAVDLYVAYDNFKVGELQGQALLDGLAARKGAGPYNIELIAGSNDDANSKPFFEGAISVLQPKIDDGTLKILSGQTTQEQVATEGWDPANVQKRMDSIISGFYKDAKLDGILSPNDTLGRAAIASATAAGLDVPVVTGQDSEDDSVASVAKGEQYQTIFKDTRGLVDAVLKQIDLAKAGQEFSSNGVANNGTIDVPADYLTPVSVTQENILEAYANDEARLDIAKKNLAS
ncbi:sugar ABC transporter substrate-binding protein [Rarobacter faecitabidus]|uniref:Monosaccharide ABC transporter substrate-binding protein (CUT2 family) n=1 Tax=Rarobacter faecitabidus TaxID=13243 RepID=A0A542ZUZ1_RARFA|nr:sugar-binding protein [Rarobacter faecitabidus]TQL64183.1 monosaccharide ABC transporter substrate-binding protein (CUT2 family) [Rarobacter faecitabidus]